MTLLLIKMAYIVYINSQQLLLFFSFLISTAQTGTTGSQSDQKQVESDKQSEPEMEHGEFQIAADLTLYANPLRVLSKKPATNHTPEAVKKNAKQESSEEKDELIAADLTKYGSPLDDKK